MGDIIRFSNELNKTNKTIQSIFSSNINSLKDSLTKIDPDEDELVFELEFFKSYISNLYKKTKDRNWKSEKKEETFIKYYNSFMEDSYDLSNLNRTYFLSLFTYCTDINSSILDNDINYTKSVIECIDYNINSNHLPNVKIFNEVIKGVTKPNIKGLVEESKEPDFLLYDIVDDLIKGKDLFTIYTLYKNVNKKIEEDEDDESIDAIKEHYVKQEKIRFFNRCSHEKNFDYLQKEHEVYLLFLNGIEYIKAFDETYKEIYLDIAFKILKLNNIDKELRDIANLTKMYLEYGAQIVEFDKEDIEHYVQLGGKDENRRF